jgi:hypothetical protein
MSGQLAVGLTCLIIFGLTIEFFVWLCWPEQ